MRRLVGAAVLAALSASSSLPAQTRGAELTREQKPVYPDALQKAAGQGNAVLIGRIDKTGAVQDPRVVWTTHEQLVEPTLTAVRAWVFRPALKNGQPVEIAANIVFPFRVRDDKGRASGFLPGPAISELAVYPADGSGRKSAPEGFPIKKGVDARVRVETSIDLPPVESARKVAVRVEAVSPTGSKATVFEDSVTVPGKGTSIKTPFSIPVGRDWEDGIWMLRFQVDKKSAGMGQFWLAADPDRFDFAAALKKK
ncbi:MAG TPA: energy transducer TonB [Thermoanaerobaculia bacterium]